MLEQFDKGCAALAKGEKHRPEIPTETIRERPENSPSLESNSQHGGGTGTGGGTSDDMARRTVEPMDEDAAFQDELKQLKTLETFGRAEEYSPSYSPASPLQEGPGQSPQ